MVMRLPKSALEEDVKNAIQKQETGKSGKYRSRGRKPKRTTSPYAVARFSQITY